MPKRSGANSLILFFYNENDAECFLRSENGFKKRGCYLFKSDEEGELIRLAERYSEVFGIRSVSLVKSYQSPEDVVDGFIKGMSAGASSVSIRVYDPCKGRLASEEARLAELVVEMAGLKLNEVEPEVEFKVYYSEGIYHAVVWELNGSNGRICTTGTRAGVVYDWSEEATRLVYSLISQGASEVYVLIDRFDPAGLRWLARELWDFKRRSIMSRVYLAAVPHGGENEFARERGITLVTHGQLRPEGYALVPDEVLRSIQAEFKPAKAWKSLAMLKRSGVVEVKGGPIGYHDALDKLLKEISGEEHEEV